MAISFDHNGHYQTISQNIQKPVHIVQYRPYLWETIYIRNNIRIKNFNLTQLICRAHVLIPENITVLSSGTVIL